MQNLVSAYKARRAIQSPPRNEDRATWGPREGHAKTALALARNDIARGETIYPPATGYGPRYEARGSKHFRWIEKPSTCGLRFVGYADELADLRHRGWYVDNDQMETVRGVVFQLPGRDGKPLFVPGYEDWNNGKADNDGPVSLSFEDVTEGEGVELVAVRGPNGERDSYWHWESDPRDHDGCRSAARTADQLAEWLAESEREYQAAWQAGVAYADLGETIAQSRHEVLDAIRQFKAARAALESGEPIPGNPIGATLAERFNRLCQIIRGDVADELESIAEARAERSKLKDGDWVSEWLPGWNSRDPNLVAAFEDGANR